MRGIQLSVMLVACVLFGAASVTTAAGWFQEGANAQHTGVTSVRISEGGHPQWTYNTDSSIMGGITISADGTRAYVGAGDGYLYCLSVNTVDSGSDDISTGFGDGAKQEWAQDLDGPITVTPTLSADGSKMFVGSGAGKFFCLDAASGDIVWQVSVSGGVSSAATLNDDFVVFGTDQFYAYVLYQSNGASKWKCLAKDEISAPPTLSSDGKSMYFGSSDTFVYGFNNIYNSTCQAGGVEPSYCQDLIKHGFKEQSGCASWWVSPALAPVSATVTLDEPNNRLIVASAAAPGESTVASIDLSKVTTGVQSASTVSTKLFGSTSTIQTGVTLLGSSNGVFGCDDGYLYNIDLSSGAQTWKADIGQAIASTPVTDGHSITFGGADKSIHCVSAASGGSFWSVPGDGAFVGAPAIAPSGMVLMGDTNGVVHAVGTVDVTVVRVLIGAVIGVFVLACCVAAFCVCRRRKRQAALRIPDNSLPGQSIDLYVAPRPEATTAYAMMMKDDEDANL